MALEISTVGAKVFYAKWEEGDTEPPTSDYAEIPDISTAPEISLEREALDASNISDTVTRYIPGRADPGGSAEFDANHTKEFIDLWENTLVGTNADGTDKRYWIEYWFPGGTYGFYFVGIPHPLGTNGIEQNAVDTIPATMTIADVYGWAKTHTET